MTGPEPTDDDPTHNAFANLGQAMHAAAARAEQAPIEARREASRAGRRWYLAGLMAAVLISTAGFLFSALDARAISTESEQRQAFQQLAQPVLAQAATANKTLTDRGQAPVPIPDPGQHPSDALVAAATARVLASLPAPQVAAPNAGLIAQAVAEYGQAHPFVASPDQIGASVAGYLAAHPPAAGPPPTAPQIQAAVAAYLTANPPAPGKDGSPGRDGKDGQNPPCMSTAAQCQGSNGKDGPPGTNGVNGTNGKDGAPGPACPPGTHLAPVIFASGQQGQGCVNDNQTLTTTTKGR